MLSKTLDGLCVDLFDGSMRSISALVEVNLLALPELPADLRNHWIECILDKNPAPNIGNVLSSDMHAPESIDAVLKQWRYDAGLDSIEMPFGTRLFACEGAWFHHDTDHDEYRRSAFSILWIEENPVGFGFSAFRTTRPSSIWNPCPF